MAELKAECPAAPLVLAVAPVRRIVPSPLLTIWRDTSRLNRKADRVAISHTFNIPVPWSVTLYYKYRGEYLGVYSGRSVENRNLSNICPNIVNSAFHRTYISLYLLETDGGY